MRVRRAESLLALERFPEAEEEAKRGHSILVAALGADSHRVTDAARALAEIYLAWNDAEPSEELRSAAQLWRRRAEN